MPVSQRVQTSVLETNDFAQLQEAGLGWDQRYSQLSPGRFTGRMDLVQVGSRQIFREYWGRKLRYQGTAPLGAFGFALPLQQPGTGNWVGQTTHAETVVVQSPGKEADMVSAEYWDALVLSVPEDELHKVASAVSNDESFREGAHATITLQEDVADKLRRIGLGFLCRVHSATPQDEAQIERYSEQFVKLFVWELLQNVADSGFRCEPARPATIVSQATELALADEASTIGLTDICASLGVSLRALHYAFRDVTGMAPATWLRTIRLNRVHAELLRTAPEETLVKQAAMDHGFFHLGHFSEQYKRLFGCLPTVTLGSK